MILLITDILFCTNCIGFRLDTTILKNIAVSDWFDCVVECATEPSCRSINYNNKEPLNLKNEANCEMLHNVVYNTSQKFLKKNSSYDHVFLMNPQKVSLLLVLGYIQLVISYSLSSENNLRFIING